MVTTHMVYVIVLLTLLSSWVFPRLALFAFALFILLYYMR